MIEFDSRVPTQSLYIHWPFCPYKCHFCPFVAFASHDQYMQQYHQALMTEIKGYAALIRKNSADLPPIKTIYMGGGTPSTYPDDLLLDMAAILKESFALGDNCRDSIEMTIEVNPGTVRIEQLALWREVGINRLSIGVQSLNDRVLKSLNRLQKASDVEWLLQEAASHHDNLSIDLILGLPGVSRDEWKQLLRKAVTWPIKHISIYFLTVHEKTPLYFKVESGQVELPSDQHMVDLYHWSRDFLADHGLHQYELSNFARDGYESRHNSAYWNRVPYRAFGVGACSFDGKVRIQNDKNLMRYIEHATEGKSVVAFSEELTPEQVRLERLMLGLRRRCGVKPAMVMQGLSGEKRRQFQVQFAELKQRKLVEERSGVLRMTQQGLLLENEVIARLSE